MDGAASNSSASVYLLSPPVLITIFYTARFASWAAFAFHSDTYGSTAAVLMVRTNEPMVRFLHHTGGALRSQCKLVLPQMQCCALGKGTLDSFLTSHKAC